MCTFNNWLCGYLQLFIGRCVQRSSQLKHVTALPHQHCNNQLRCVNDLGMSNSVALSQLTVHRQQSSVLLRRGTPLAKLVIIWTARVRAVTHLVGMSITEYVDTYKMQVKRYFWQAAVKHSSHGSGPVAKVEMSSVTVWSGYMTILAVSGPEADFSRVSEDCCHRTLLILSSSRCSLSVSAILPCCWQCGVMHLVSVVCTVCYCAPILCDTCTSVLKTYCCFWC